MFSKCIIVLIMFSRIHFVRQMIEHWYYIFYQKSCKYIGICNKKAQAFFASIWFFEDSGLPYLFKSTHEKLTLKAWACINRTWTSNDLLKVSSFQRIKLGLITLSLYVMHLFWCSFFKFRCKGTNLFWNHKKIAKKISISKQKKLPYSHLAKLS